MSLASTLAAGQASWLAELATDTCRITRTAVAGDDEYVEQVLNEETLQYPTQGRVLVYEGPCRFQVKVDINSNVVETTAGEHEFTYLTGQLQLPVAAPPGSTGDPADVDVDNVCECLTAPYDPALVGTKHNVAGPFHKSHAINRRFRIREEAA